MKHNTILQSLLLILALLLPGAVAACSALPQISAVEGAERDQAVALAEPMADVIFQGMNTADYTLFAQDFDDEMKKALTEAAFNEMMQAFTPKIGAYQSREVVKVEVIDEVVYVISYQARFEKEDAVAVRLSVRKGDPAQVAGLYFDSPKLREK